MGGIKKIKSIFFDIDGTLVSFKTHSVPRETVEAIRMLRARGIKVFVATGRMLTMLSVLDGIEFDGYIAYNGGCCIDDKGNVIFQQTVGRSELEALVARLREDKFPVSFMRRDGMFVNYLAPVVLEVAEMVNVPPPVVMEPEKIIMEDVYQLCIYVDEMKLDTILKNTLPSCHGSRWTPQFADVNVKGLSKNVGIDRVLDHFGLDLDSTMAFGDGGNDIPMLRHVAVGIAMGDSDDAVKAAADYVTDSVDNQGIVKALSHFGDKLA